MGKLLDGKWVDDDVSATNADGKFRRSRALLRNWVTPDGAPGPTGEGGFEAEVGRYHLYIAINCPWAHRAAIFRKLKDLEDAISLSVCAPRRTDQGWVFDPDDPRYRDDLLGMDALHQVYTAAQPDYSGRVTCPVLWDKQRRTIVSNESAEIIRMFNRAFLGVAGNDTDFCPPELEAEIDALNATIYATVNNGVYRAGFARSQDAYEEAATALFATLDDLERRLSRTRYLLGDRPTEADWRLFPTLARFDVAYYGAFKCNLRRLIDYRNLWPYARELYQWPGIADTVDFGIYKRGYFSRSALRNPHGIVPKGPDIDFSEPHGRG